MKKVTDTRNSTDSQGSLENTLKTYITKNKKSRKTNKFLKTYGQLKLNQVIY